MKKVRNLKGSLSDEILIPTSSDFLDHWDNAIKALEYALNLLQNPQEFGVISSKYLPYFSIIPAFASLMKTVTNLPANRRLSAQQKFVIGTGQVFLPIVIQALWNPLVLEILSK